MFNQLVHSSQREKKFKRHLYNDFLKQTQQIDSPPLFRNQSTLRDKQQQIYDKLLSNSLDGQRSGDLSQIIKQRLQSKKVEYPKDFLMRLESPSRNINTEGIQINLPDKPSRRYHHDSIKRSRRRIKTLVDDSATSSQEQSEPYKQTLKEIDELNHIFFTNTKRKAKQHLQLLRFDTPQPQRRPQRQFYHISRQHDFQQYINHLQKQHSRERERYTPVRQRVREVPSYKKMEEKPVMRIELPASPDSRKKDTFIKILQKVKARGQSLLVKLNKFPSLKHIIK